MYSPRDYEQFTQALHQRIIDEEGYDSVKVLHNQIFIGQSKAKHQIDVCWTLEIGRIQQLFCVECKLWKQKVKKDHIASFISKLNDIGNARGIFVTTQGFQVGAIRLAKHHGITLIHATYEVENKEATLSLCLPRYYDFHVIFEDAPADTLSELEQLQESDISETEVKLFDSEGKYLGTLNELRESFSHDQDGYYEQEIEDTFMHLSNGPLKIVKFSYIYEQNIIGRPLKSEYEIANARAHYIFNDKEFSAILNSHRNPSFDLE
jgi:hypothetical protein